MSDAVKEALLLARSFVAGAATVPPSTVFDDHAFMLLLSRAVIDQAADIATLKAALREALDGYESMWRSENNGEPPPDMRLAELRRLA